MFFRHTYPALLWAGFILLLTLTSGKEFPEVTLMSFDKLVHVFLFSVQAYLFTKGFMRQSNFIALRYSPAVYSLVVSVLLGASTELMQSFLLADRAGDIYDFTADAIGALTGIIIFVWIYGKSGYAKR